mgnify:CR=1 FL=1
MISMSCKENCWDNYGTESFIDTLKAEYTNHEAYKNKKQARMSLFQYIEGFYNHKRRYFIMENVLSSQVEEKTV